MLLYVFVLIIINVVLPRCILYLIYSNNGNAGGAVVMPTEKVKISLEHTPGNHNRQPRGGVVILSGKLNQ